MYGIALLPPAEGRPLAAYHAWTEVWLGDWIGVDATVPETGTAARYIQQARDLGAHGLPDQEKLGRLMRTAMGKPRITLHSYRRASGEWIVPDVVAAPQVAVRPDRWGWVPIGTLLGGVLLLAVIAVRMVRHRRDRVVAAQAQARLRQAKSSARRNS